MSLPIAVEENDVEEITRLLSTEAVDLNSKNPQGRASLHVAVGKENVELVKMLIDKNCDVDIRDSLRWTALHQAALKGHGDIVNALIAAGCNVNDVDGEERTALHHAASQGSAEVVQALIDADCNVDVRDQELETALHIATRKGHLAIMKVLISNGAIVSLPDKKGQTPMHIAVSSGKSTLVSLLVGAHIQALLNTKNSEGVPAKEATTEKKTTKVVKQLLRTAEKWEKRTLKEMKSQKSEETRDIFISYQWDNQEEAQALAERLKDRGHTCWIDTDAIVGGDRLYGEIGKGLKESRVVICCITPQYTQSKNCEKEVILADQLGRQIIPLMIRETSWPLDNDAMAVVLAPLTYIDIYNSLQELREFKGPKIDNMMGRIEDICGEPLDDKSSTKSEVKKCCPCFDC